MKIKLLKMTAGWSAILFAASQVALMAADEPEPKVQTGATAVEGGSNASGGGGGSTGASSGEQIQIISDGGGRTWVGSSSGGGGSGGGGFIGGGGGGSGGGGGPEFRSRLNSILVKGDGIADKDAPWLGVGTEEAPEVLTSQLGLDPGVGLVVTYLAPDSPAAKAGLEKNDVLVEFHDQALVHPMQLRKLVRVRKEGDSIKLTYYRAGKKHTVSATLVKTPAEFGMAGPEPRTARLGEAADRVQEEVRRNMDAARKKYMVLLQQAINGSTNLEALHKIFDKMNIEGISVGKNSSFILRSTGNGARSLVQSDDTGTIVILSSPRLHLMALDKDGKLVFDGEIETAEQRAKVSAELWKKAEPLVNKLNSGPARVPEFKPGLPKETTFLHRSGVI